jgi:hypothetical protein
MQVFLSYSRLDRDFVGRLADDLAARGIESWLDTDDLPTNDEDRWRRAVVHGIRDSAALILVLSPNSVSSAAVERELTIAAEVSRRIIPIVHRACQLSDGLMFELAGLQRTDFVEQPYEIALDNLVRRILAGSPAATAVPPPPVLAPQPVNPEVRVSEDGIDGGAIPARLSGGVDENGQSVLTPHRSPARRPSWSVVAVSALVGVGIAVAAFVWVFGSRGSNADRDAALVVTEAEREGPGTSDRSSAPIEPDGTSAAVPTAPDPTTPASRDAAASSTSPTTPTNAPTATDSAAAPEEDGPAVLGPGDRLLVGEFLPAHGGRYVLEMTADDGLRAVTLGQPDPWWSTGVVATADGAAIMQITDGNLVIYTRNPPPGDQTAVHDAVYDSGTVGHPGASLILHELNGHGVLDIVDADGELVTRLGTSA